MTIRDLIFIFIGLGVSFSITWILLIRKFFMFINNEIHQNELYRKNATESLALADDSEHKEVDAND